MSDKRKYIKNPFAERKEKLGRNQQNRSKQVEEEAC